MFEQESVHEAYIAIRPRLQEMIEPLGEMCLGCTIDTMRQALKLRTFGEIHAHVLAPERLSEHLLGMPICSHTKAEAAA